MSEETTQEAPAMPPFIVGLEDARPATAVNRTIYYCSDSSKYYRYENNKWNEVTKR